MPLSTVRREPGQFTEAPQGKEIVGVVRTEIVADDDGVFSMPLSADPRIASYETASTDKSAASLTVREKSYEARMPIPASDWEYAACEKDDTGKDVIRPSTTDLYFRSGFKPNHIYEFIYPAKNPLVLGLGFAAVRDTFPFSATKGKTKRESQTRWLSLRLGPVSAEPMPGAGP